MEHRIETVRPFDVVGIQIRTNNAKAMETIGPLWGKFFDQNLAEQIPGRVDDCTYGVYDGYESDHTGEYNLLVGCKVSGNQTPAGMKRVKIKGGKYAVVTAKGEMPEALINAWVAIWGSGLPRAFTQDYELLDPSKADQEEIWIALK